MNLLFPLVTFLTYILPKDYLRNAENFHSSLNVFYIDYKILNQYSKYLFNFQVRYTKVEMGLLKKLTFLILILSGKIDQFWTQNTNLYKLTIWRVWLDLHSQNSKGSTKPCPFLFCSVTEYVICMKAFLLNKITETVGKQYAEVTICVKYVDSKPY